MLSNNCITKAKALGCPRRVLEVLRTGQVHSLHKSLVVAVDKPSGCEVATVARKEACCPQLRQFQYYMGLVMEDGHNSNPAPTGS